ncbi:MAG: MFS transporter [Thermodesulfovibrionaceae bacterium]
MSIKCFFAIIYTTVLTISALHMPQPLLPVIGNFFGKSMDTVSLIMSATFIPLTFIPIISSFILNFFSPKKVVIFCATIHSLVVFLMSITNNIFFIIFLRFIEGFLISAILTSNTTYISLVSKLDKIQFFMSYYIAFTITGGLLGRLIGSAIANFFGWKTCFQIMSVSLLLVLPIVSFMMENVKLPKSYDTKIFTMKIIKKVLSRKINYLIFLSVFSIFFVFSGVTNFLPFRIKSLNPQSGELIIGIIYSGYITGIFTSFVATKIVKLVKSEKKALLLGSLTYGLFLSLFITPSIPIIFMVMFGFCAGMFLVHSVASGYLNKLATEQKNLINGLYISFYYAGGVLGSYIPGVIYKNFGWLVFLIFLMFFIAFTILHLSKLPNHL